MHKFLFRSLSTLTFFLVPSFILQACSPFFLKQHSLYFDGIDDYVEISNTTVFNEIGSGNFTFEVWIKALENGQVQHPQIMSNRSSTSRGFLFGFHDRWGGSKNKIPFVQIDSINWIDYPKQPNLLDGQWHHFVARREGDTLTYFADGQPVVSLTTDRIGNYNLGSDSTLLIGWDLVNPTASIFQGHIDELRIWNRALSEAEIQSGMFRSPNNNTTDLLAYWSFVDILTGLKPR